MKQLKKKVFYSPKKKQLKRKVFYLKEEVVEEESLLLPKEGEDQTNQVDEEESLLLPKDDHVEEASEEAAFIA